MSKIPVLWLLQIFEQQGTRLQILQWPKRIFRAGPNDIMDNATLSLPEIVVGKKEDTTVS